MKHVVYIHILNTVQTIIQCFNSLTTQQPPPEMQRFMPSIFIKNYPISSTPWVKTCIFSCYKDNTTLFFSSIQILATVQKVQIMNRFHIQVKSCLNKTAWFIRCCFIKIQQLLYILFFNFFLSILFLWTCFSHNTALPTKFEVAVVVHYAGVNLNSIFTKAFRKSFMI